MKTFLTIISIIGIIVLCLIVQHKFFPSVVTTTTIDTVYDTKVDTEYIAKPEYDTIVYYRYIDNSTHDTVYLPGKIDTLKVLKDYYAVVKYRNLTVKNDSSITAIFNADVTQNRIDSLWMTFTNNRPTIINNYIENNNNEFFIGGVLGTNEITPKLLYKRNDFIYEVGYDFIGQDKGFRIGMGYKIK